MYTPHCPHLMLAHLAVPLDLLRGGRVEEESVRVLVALLHALAHVVASAELVAHAVALVVEDEAAASAEGLGGEEENLRGSVQHQGVGSSTYEFPGIHEQELLSGRVQELEEMRHMTSDQLSDRFFVSFSGGPQAEYSLCNTYGHKDTLVRLQPHCTWLLTTSTPPLIYTFTKQ